MTYPDSILFQVAKPARYTGGEWNAIVKDWSQTAIKVALSYPEIYEIGMSNLALPILYDILNRQPDVLAERVFAPWVDMAAALRAARMPLLSLESQRPLKDFDIIGFSLGYELDYTNVLSILDLAGVPLMAAERNDDHPLVIAGGSAALNPEPMADFIDLFIIGDGEEVLLKLIDCFRSFKGQRGSKRELLLKLAAISGIYIPSLYHIEYESDGRVKSITPTAAEASPAVKRQIVDRLPPPVVRPVVPYIEAVQDRGAVEISRGCNRGCRFCHAGAIYRPVRERPPEEVLKAVDELMANCGYDEISLVSLSTSDYSHIEELVESLARYQRRHRLTISLPSLRINRSSIKLVKALSSQRKTGLTLAPEAGSQRLQRVINKVTSEDELMETASAAFLSGLTTLKLYFMLGLPTETMDDIEGIIEMVNKVFSLGKRVAGRRPQLRVNLGTFVPKAHTPFQWLAQEDEEELNLRQQRLKQGLKNRRIRLSWQDSRVSLLEAALSRGDRRLGRVIYGAYKLGSTFDAWSERFNYQNWLTAFAEAGLNPDFYARRQRPLDELLPWSHIDTGLSTDFLKREYKRALEGVETADCRTDTCNICGLEKRHPECQQSFLKL